jgi:hypothetical protein
MEKKWIAGDVATGTGASSSCFFNKLKGTFPTAITEHKTLLKDLGNSILPQPLTSKVDKQMFNDFVTANLAYRLAPLSIPISTLSNVRSSKGCLASFMNHTKALFLLLLQVARSPENSQVQYENLLITRNI